MNLLKRLKAPSLGVQLLLSLVLGILAALLLPQFVELYAFLGKAFLNLISMLIVPLVFPLVVVAVAGIVTKKRFSKLLVTSLVYFFVVTTAITAIFVFGAYVTGFGRGVNIGQEGASLEGIATSLNLSEFFLGFIPSNIVNALATGSLLPIIVFAIFLGYGIGKLEEDKSKVILSGFNIWIEAIYHIVNVVVALSPIGIFGFIAKDLVGTGFAKLLGLGQFVIGVFIAYAILALVIFPIIAIFFKVPYVKLVKTVWELLTIAFVSGSSSVVLPPLLESLKQTGHDQTTVDFVVPLGYSFNLEGAAVYFAMATIFIANAYSIELSIGQLFYIVLILTLIGKTAATIPSGAIVVLLAIAPQIGLPVEGVALIFAVDFFANAGRTALNVLGQALTVSVLEKTSVQQEEVTGSLEQLAMN